MDRSLSKKERLSSHAAIEHLIGGGRYISNGPLRCCYIYRQPSQPDRDADIASASAADDGEPAIRIMVSVPKKFFKRAVKRNLLKRRIREAYRLQKASFPSLRADMMFIYSSKEILPYESIRFSVGEILKSIDGKR